MLSGAGSDECFKVGECWSFLALQPSISVLNLIWAVVESQWREQCGGADELRQAENK